MSDGRVTLGNVQLRHSHLDGIPPDNVSVPVREFARGWFAAEQLHDDRVRRGVSDWYGAGVVGTCRWLARATVRPESGPWYAARSPVTRRQRMAHPEYVDEEMVAAHTLAVRRDKPAWVLAQPGWLDGVLDTFDWAWRRTRDRPPIDMDDFRAG
jgi:hypothetical protein